MFWRIRICTTKDRPAFLGTVLCCAILQGKHTINPVSVQQVANEELPELSIASADFVKAHLIHELLELQGVIGHEFSHILNGDMRLNLRLIGLIHGILCIAILGRVLLRTGRRSSSGGKGGNNPLPLIGIALLVIGGKPVTRQVGERNFN